MSLSRGTDHFREELNVLGQHVQIILTNSINKNLWFTTEITNNIIYTVTIIKNVTLACRKRKCIINKCKTVRTSAYIHLYYVPSAFDVYGAN